MSDAIKGLEADRAAVLEVCAGLADADWQAESGCPGWSVKDLISHLAAGFYQVVDPSALPDAAGAPTEETQEIFVRARRGMTPGEVLADYEAVSAKALEALMGFVGQDLEIPLGDLGTYPMSVLPSAFSFDHFVHLRGDLFAPRGPRPGPAPAADELRLAPTLDWIEAALPQQNRERMAAVTDAVRVDITGPAARSITVGTGAAATRVTLDGPTFVWRITGRQPWPDAPATLQGLRVF